jgi:hypothetical protein
MWRLTPGCSFGSRAAWALEIHENGFENVLPGSPGTTDDFSTKCAWPRQIVILSQGNITVTGLALPAANPYMK